MEIASILLTKKAALMGGGTAAATTAVVVPVVVTQKNKKSARADGGDASAASESEEKDRSGLTKNPFSELDLTLEIDSKALINSFNKPGYCIKKIFPGVEEPSSENAKNKKGIFNKPKSWEGVNETQKINTVDLTSNSQGVPNVTSMDYACLMFNQPFKENTKDFRVELVIKKGNYGWMWMSARHNNDVAFREVVLHKVTKNNVEKWDGYVGVDGKYKVNADDDITPKFSDGIFDNLDEYKTQSCVNEGCIKAVAAIFTKENNGTKSFLPRNENEWNQAILALKGSTDYQGNGADTKRDGYFGDSTWYKHSSTQDTNLITFSKEQILSNIKGTWNDLIPYCQDETKKTEPAFIAICPAQ